MEVEKFEKVNVNSRTVKMHTLMEIFAREQTSESLAEYMDEVKSMREYDRIFAKFSKFFSGKIEAKQYDPSNIQFECLKESIDYYESKHGKLSDYGLKYISHFARACEI